MSFFICHLKKYFSLGMNDSTFSTQLMSMTPKSKSEKCERLQNLDQIGVNDSKIGIKLASTAPKS